MSVCFFFSVALPFVIDDLATTPAPDRAAALADGEAQLLLHGDRNDQRDLHGHVVARITISVPSGNVTTPVTRWSGVELRPVIGEERRVTATLLLGQDVGLGLELGVRFTLPGLQGRPRLHPQLCAQEHPPSSSEAYILTKEEVAVTRRSHQLPAAILLPATDVTGVVTLPKAPRW